MLVLRRHAERITDLTPDEWTELQGEIQRATQALTLTFQPDHFNYMFLQNQDRHVHLHIVPRYAVPSPIHHLTDNVRDALADTLKTAYQTL